MSFKLKLVDENQEVCKQFEEQCSKFADIEVYCDFFQEVNEYDCMVSPANSFWMVELMLQ